jgi:hypothetical protein
MSSRSSITETSRQKPVSSKYVKSAGIEVYHAGSETVAVVAGTDAVHVLNDVAAQILELCKASALDEIAESIARSYPDVPPNTIHEDVTWALDELQKKGLVQPTPDGTHDMKTGPMT